MARRICCFGSVYSLAVFLVWQSDIWSFVCFASSLLFTRGAVPTALRVLLMFYF